MNLLHSMLAFMCFIVNYVWWKGRYIVPSPYGCRKWNCLVDVTFIAKSGFVQPTSLQRSPPWPHIPLKESQNCDCFTEWISEASAHISVFTALTHPANTAVMTAALKITLPIVSSWVMKDFDLIHYTGVQIVSSCIKTSYV